MFKYTFILLISLTLPNLSQAREELILNTAFTMPLSSEQQDGTFDRLMQATFDRLDMDVFVERPPAERALRQANSGLEDGDGPRISGLNKYYPNLLQVPEKVIDINFVAFTQGNLQFSTQDWDSLKSYNVGIVTGWKILEKHIVNSKSLLKLKNPKALMTALKKGEIDVAVISEETGRYIGKQVGIEKLNVMQPAFASREMFLYLHKKHKALIPEVADILRQLKDEGIYQQIMQSN